MSTEREFYVPSLEQKGAWKEITSTAEGGANWRGLRYYKDTSKIAIHHTVTHAVRNWRTEVDVVRRIHMVTNGWGGIGYNFIISSQESNGYAITAKIGSMASIRAHAPNSKGIAGIPVNHGNYYILGISFIGMLHINRPTDAQLRSAHELVKELIYREDARLPKLANWSDMMAHKDFDATACPGDWAWQKPRIISPPPISQPPPPPDPCEAEIKKAVDPLKTKINVLETANTNLANTIVLKGKIIDEQTVVISSLKDELVASAKECGEKILELEKQHKLDLEDKDQKIQKLTEDYTKLYDDFMVLKGQYDELLITCRWEEPNSFTEWVGAFLSWLRKTEVKTPEAEPPPEPPDSE